MDTGQLQDAVFIETCLSTVAFRKLLVLHLHVAILMLEQCAQVLFGSTPCEWASSDVDVAYRSISFVTMAATNEALNWPVS